MGKIVEKGARKNRLKVGDSVMVIAGGNKSKRPIKGSVGKILSFRGADRVVIDGVNPVWRVKRPTVAGGEVERVQGFASVHVSNVMFYSEKFSRPFRLSAKFLEGGKKVRGFLAPDNGDFVQV